MSANYHDINHKSSTTFGSNFGLASEFSMAPEYFEIQLWQDICLALSIDRERVAFDQVRSARISNEWERSLREAKKLQTLRHQSLVEAVCFGWRSRITRSFSCWESLADHVRRRTLLQTIKTFGGRVFQQNSLLLPALFVGRLGPVHKTESEKE